MQRTYYAGRMMGRALALVLSCLGPAFGCGGSSPPGPGPIVPPPVSEPIIRSVAVGSARAEAGEIVTVGAEVEDAETPVQSLRYEWSANVGVFEGTGAAVTWHMPKGSASTPVDVVITLTVVEPYDALVNGAITTREHRVSRSALPFRVHDSVAEISAMTVTFLVDYFGDSSVSPDACVVDFSDSCRGKDVELEDIIWNREHRIIYSAQATVTSVIVGENRTFASVVASCRWEDADVTTPDRREFPQGQCILTAIYEAGRWWLCSSHFNADEPMSDAEVSRWLAPSAAGRPLPTVAGGVSRRPSGTK